jgi:hypothetical protein
MGIAAVEGVEVRVPVEGRFREILTLPAYDYLQ